LFSILDGSCGVGRGQAVSQYTDSAAVRQFRSCREMSRRFGHRDRPVYLRGDRHRFIPSNGISASTLSAPRAVRTAVRKKYRTIR
jgi:hypothetical protein